MTTTAKVRPVAVVPPPAAVRVDGISQTGLGPIVPQSKRQHHFQDTAIELAAKYGWSGEPNAEILGLRVADAQNFLRKTLHEIHVAAAGGSPCPDFAPVAAHFEHVDPKDETKTVRSLDAEDTAELLETLTSVYDAEVAELKSHDPKKLEQLFKANAAEDIETRKRHRIAMALDGAEG